jgi:hypothetical protein
MVLIEIREERLIERQSSKYKQRAARTQYQKLDKGILRWDSELSDERLITRSKTWYHGMHERDLVELLCEVVGFRNKLQQKALSEDPLYIRRGRFRLIVLKLREGVRSLVGNIIWKGIVERTHWDHKIILSTLMHIILIIDRFIFSESHSYL